MNHLVVILTLKLIFQIMQQKWTLKKFHMLIPQVLNLASLKTELDQLDIDKLVSVPVDLSELSDVVKNDVVKKTADDKLGAKVNNIDTGGFVLKLKYNTDKAELEKKVPDTSGLLKIPL